MTRYDTRSVLCPDCDSPDTTVERYFNGDRAVDPGARAFYRCEECGTQFIAFVPEPIEPGEADGEAFRSGEALAYLREQMADARRLK